MVERKIKKTKKNINQQTKRKRKRTENKIDEFTYN